MPRKAALLFWAAALLFVSLTAAVAGSATVSGALVFASGKPVAGALVRLTDEGDPRRVFEDITALDGAFAIEIPDPRPTAVAAGAPRPRPAALFPNYPNPFNPSTRIPYRIAVPGPVRLRVYNLLGQPIRTLVDHHHPAGTASAEWDGRTDNGTGAAAGIYLVRLETADLAETRKMVLVDGTAFSGPAATPAFKPLQKDEPQALFSLEVEGGGAEPLRLEGIALRADTTLQLQVDQVNVIAAGSIALDLFDVGMRALEQGRFDEAAETFRRAVVVSPYLAVQVQARYYLGVTLMRMGRFDAAVAPLRNVIDLDPDHPSARWHLRLSLSQQGLDPQSLLAPYRLDLAPTIPPAHAPPRFSEVGRQAGVDRFGMGRGSGWRDIDDDGWLDVLAVEDGAPHALYRNNGDGTFADIAAQCNLADSRGGWSALWADYDNDGDADVYVTRDGFQGSGPNSLYRNNGDGTFEDATEAAQINDAGDSFCAAWGDYDNDGFLDLYVGNGIARKGAPNTLFRNNGDGTFEDVSTRAGVADGIRATIGAAWGDYDNDGRLDLYVVNNGGACALYRNNGNGTFDDVTEAAGVVGPLFGFVAFFIDYDLDGWLDLFVSSTSQTQGEAIDSAVSGKPSLFFGNRGYLYRNNGDGTFEDITLGSGLERTLGTMAATYGDIDNDGYPDIYLANGGPAMDRFEPDLLYLNNRDGGFADITLAAGINIIDKGHGTTMADYDNDGDLDIYSPQGGVGGNAGQAQANRLLRNEGTDNHWLSLKLAGKDGASNRDAIGAQIQLRVGGGTRLAHVDGGSGFGVTNSLPLEFGLGSFRTVDEIEIRWPSGHVQRLTDVEADQKILIVEGATR